MVFIYLLQLIQGKFYVGKTDNPKFRLDSHFKNGGCAWTKKYKPQQIIALFPDCDDFDEDKYTLKYMSKYGIDNVRGGSFCRSELKDKSMIERMITSSNDCCHFCGEKGHFIGNCTKEKEKNKYSKQNKHFLELSKDYESADEVEWEEDEESDEDISPENLETAFSEMDKDDGLYSFDGNKYLWCDGELYEESSTQTPKKLLKHFEANDMRYTTDYVDYNWKSIHEKKKTPSTRKCGCHKCGRKGHYASNCYARKHINGNYL